jgi:uncharacterized membrane protein required for colicin V production
MTGADFFIAVILFVLGWAGTTRGVIKEFFEFLIVTINPILCSYLYGPVGNLLTRYAHVPKGIAAIISFLFFFLLFAFILWVLAGNTEASANIPPHNGLNQLGGLVFALAKALVMIWVVLLGFSLIPMTKTGRAFFSKSFSVRMIESLNPTLDEILYATASRQAYQFIHPKIKKFNF